MMKLRPGEVKILARGPIAHTWQSQDLTLSTVALSKAQTSLDQPCALWPALPPPPPAPPGLSFVVSFTEHISKRERLLCFKDIQMACPHLSSMILVFYQAHYERNLSVENLHTSFLEK